MLAAPGSRPDGLPHASSWGTLTPLRGHSPSSRGALSRLGTMARSANESRATCCRPAGAQASGAGTHGRREPEDDGLPCDSSDQTRLRPGSPACGLLGASAIILGFQEFYVFTENTSKSKTAVCPPSCLTEAGNVSAGEGLATAGPASHPSTLPRGRRSHPRPARRRLRTFRRNPPRSTEAACVLAGSCGSHGEPHSRFPGTEQRPPGQTRKPRGSSGASYGAAVVP